jgi:hypothetical protein
MDGYICKIFDRTGLIVVDIKSETPGLIFFISIFKFIIAKDIVENFVLTDDVFKLKITIASKILNMDTINLISLNHYNDKQSDLIVHPILIKSILRHVDKTIIK